MYKILEKVIYNSRSPEYTKNQETLEEYLNTIESKGGELVSILSQDIYSDCIIYEFIFKFEKGE